MPTTSQAPRGLRVPPTGVPGFGLATLAGRIALRLLGDGRTSTAAGNAWQAVCADRERAAERVKIESLFPGSR